MGVELLFKGYSPGQCSDIRDLLSGIIIRVLLRWNSGRLVPGTLGGHRYQTKTHGSHHLGHKLGTKSPQTKPV